jgi:isopentenyl-diphosphate delta-isomerase
MEQEQVILVNERDEQLGLMEKLEAHRKGVLHRAVSVFVFNKKGELLLQKRTSTKYHGAGLWTNTCCTHPRDGETNLECANRRLKEEMGFETPLEEKFSFVYKGEVENGLIEYEFDHVFFGVHDGEVKLNAEEVEDCTFVSLGNVSKDADQHPERFSIWFRIIIKKFTEHLSGMEHQLQKAVGVKVKSDNSFASKFP